MGAHRGMHKLIRFVVAGHRTTHVTGSVEMIAQLCSLEQMASRTFEHERCPKKVRVAPQPHAADWLSRSGH